MALFMQGGVYDNDNQLILKQMLSVFILRWDQELLVCFGSGLPGPDRYRSQSRGSVWEARDVNITLFRQLEREKLQMEDLVEVRAPDLTSSSVKSLVPDVNICDATKAPQLSSLLALAETQTLTMWN